MLEGNLERRESGKLIPAPLVGESGSSFSISYLEISYTISSPGFYSQFSILSSESPFISDELVDFFTFCQFLA